jgi:exonuclease VII large subunit
MPKENINQHNIKLQECRFALKQIIAQTFMHRNHWHANADQIIDLTDPVNTLKKGYTYVTQNEKIIPAKNNVMKGNLQIHFADGSLELQNN